MHVHVPCPRRSCPLKVLHHPATLSYLALSGLAGLALTYYYNNTENHKVGAALAAACLCAALLALRPALGSRGFAQQRPAVCVQARRAWPRKRVRTACPPQINTMLRVALQLVGLGAVYCRWAGLRST